MSDDLTTQCDCAAFFDSAQDAHQMACALWDNDLFAKGYADWEPKLAELVLVHPLHQSLHTATDDEIGGEIGEVVVEQLDPVEIAGMVFEDRCIELERNLWDAFEKDLVDWPLCNYTIDGISRVFNPEYGEWTNAALKCHCDPPADKSCVRCGVVREKAEGTYWEKMWRPQIIRKDDVICRCPLKKSSQWHCIKCGVKRLPPNDECEPLARPMVEWTQDMAKRKAKTKATGGATAWGGWKGGTTTYVLCRHKGRELEFPNGKKIYGSSCHAKAPDGYVPDFGIYLDSCWFNEAENLGIMLPWADMGLPKLDRDHVDTALDLACRMIDKGDILEVGCIGGHGRTGTFLALVAMKNGVETAEEAINYVREHYCKEAIESATQEWFIKAWYAEEHDLPVPEKPKPKPLVGGVGVANNYLQKHHANEDQTVEKHVDTSFVWYCPLCNADVADDADFCYWCLGKFSNPGIQPLEEWSIHVITDAKKLADIAIRMTEPQTPKKREEPKAVTTGDKVDQPTIPFAVDAWDEALGAF